ncbi:protein PET117 homolog, mitochondrial-like [Folsomia candida]|uniref:protein PET117 homolog, mitochondrial-like n=1 Tax=Folsomia candida TaxID=158441 RepID=UPI000B8FC4AC|nr:protein PET117 homolog, mitochondrial-like [Folsomia candida]
MSKLAKTVFGTSCVITAGTIGYVHLRQHLDRQNLHEGITKDLERQEKNVFPLEATSHSVADVKQIRNSNSSSSRIRE